MGSYLGAVWRCRFFWLSLVHMDLRHRYRGSVLGMGWSLLHPIAMMAILCTVFHGIFKVDVWRFAPFLLAGLAFWNYIVTSTLQGCQCFFRGEPYIRQYPAPVAIYPLRATLGAGIHFLVALALVLVFVWCIKGFGNLPALLSLVPTLLLLFVFGWCLAVMAGFTNVFFQDTQHLCEVGFQILFYTTPVMYEASLLEGNHLAAVVKYNPLALFLRLLREPILDGRVPPAGTFLAAGVIVLASTAAAALTLARLQRRLIFHL